MPATIAIMRVVPSAWRRSPRFSLRIFITCRSLALPPVDQEPGTEPITGAVGTSDSTTVPRLAFQASAHWPPSWIFSSQVLMNSLKSSSPCLRPMP
jgi:hypothetical protein